MAKLFFLPIALLISTGAVASDYATSPCIPPANLNAEENTADYQSGASDANNAIAAEIHKSVSADLALPLSNYSNAAPSESRLYAGDVNISGGQVSINGVEVESTAGTTPPPCVIELKPAE